MNDVNNIILLFVWECHCTGQTNDAGNGGSCASKDSSGNWCYVDGSNPDCIDNYSITKSGSRYYSFKICSNPYIVFFLYFFSIFFFLLQKECTWVTNQRNETKILNLGGFISLFVSCV